MLGLSKESSLNFKLLVAAIGLSAAMITSAHAVEKYPATVKDGTAELIQSNTAVDELMASHTVQTPGIDAPPKRREKEKAVVKVETKKAEVAELKRQNDELKKRLKEIEAAQAEPSIPADGALADGEVPAESMDIPAADVSSAAADVSTSAVNTRAQEKTEAKAEAKVASSPVPSKVDVVPDNQVHQIAERLKYTNEILKRFGLAYDYRVTTLAEFKRILSDLETKQPKSAKQ